MEDFTQFNTKSLEKQSGKIFQKTYKKAHEITKYINDMKDMAIRGYHNQRLLSFMIGLPIIGGLFRATIIFYCKTFGYHPFIHVLTIKDYLGK